ncbi:hypothetical protein [Klebsiella aerogenes EA1509E]|nr:hypothetical protein [Klebsiella aerogenes EA1509E]
MLRHRRQAIWLNVAAFNTACGVCQRSQRWMSIHVLSPM